MSNRYKGAVISATPPTTTGGESGTASGAWTLEQQMQLQAAGLWPSQPPDPSLFIENLFSTYLYTGNNSTQTITNNIDLAGKGGLVILKNRSNGSFPFFWWDSARGVNALFSDRTDAEQNYTGDFVSFNSNGFSLGSPTNTFGINGNNYSQVSWTLRKQPKFFDVVTYTGNGATSQTISHNLQSVPGVIIVKRLDAASDWLTGALFTASNYTRLKLNTTSAGVLETGYTDGFYSQPTSSTFAVNSSGWNVNGATYVAYLFAHNAGGFGLTGTDNVISCGSFTNSGSSTATVNLGYEPQWLMVKSTVTAQNWFIFDTMRGMPWSSGANYLNPNTSSAETGSGPTFSLTATGFNLQGFIASEPYIYIAIRRGPMKVPTVGTTVFSPVLTATASETVNTVNFAPDMQLIKQTGNAVGTNAVDRLRGVSTRYQYNDGKYLLTSSTAAEASNYSTQYWNNTGFSTPYDTSGISTIYWTFKRAPSFFDEVCYIGTGSARTIAHNLTVAPELMIVKCRSTARAWPVYAAPLGNTEEPRLNESSASGSSTSWNSTTPTSSVFSVSNGSIVNASGDTYVAYLFATCAGVSKVGSYTGTATTLQVDCGFTGGARFVLIKRTDSTGDWYVWDTARGIVSGNDSYLLLNSNAAEVTNTDYIDTYSAGFEISSTAPAAINASGGSFIFLAIA